jgi:hypothetical protein
VLPLTRSVEGQLHFTGDLTMGAFREKPLQRILIKGKKYKDGARVLRKSEVDADVPDGEPGKGVKLGVRIATNQSVVELKLGQAEIHGLPRDGESASELESQDAAGGEKWVAWRVPRALLPNNLHSFRTTFRLTPPVAVQTVK